MASDGVVGALVTAHEAPWLGVSHPLTRLTVLSMDWLTGEHPAASHGRPRKIICHYFGLKRIEVIAHTAFRPGKELTIGKTSLRMTQITSFPQQWSFGWKPDSVKFCIVIVFPYYYARGQSP